MEFYTLSCANDWTFDYFMEDAKLYNATAIKGVYPNRNASDREKFMVWFKNFARDFKIDWLKKYKKIYVFPYGYCGDAFKKALYNSCFSDYYKDVYNQRPHLDYWYYVQATGLHTEEDTARTFCASPVESAVDMAKWVRKKLSSWF